jgi:hypothetical protein
MKRLLTAAAASFLLILALVGPVGAADTPGCSYFGTVATGDVAPHGVVGAMISSLAPRSDLLGPGTRISDIVAFEHGLYCAHP